MSALPSRTAPLLVAIGLVGMTSPSVALDLVGSGKRPLPIVLAADALLPERTAAAELADYLGRVTGAPFTVQVEGVKAAPARAIHVGPTRAALALGLGPDALGPEEWAIRTGSYGLVLAGGRPRGTLYAVYRFLEDVIGVHWWNPWEETVPTRATLSVGRLDLRGQPGFRYRDIYMIYGHDGGRFAARNRLNRDGDVPITAEYGGTMDYGPPYHVHTFYSYIPPETYFADHPEWFSLIGGKHQAEGGQLCLTNPELRRVFLEKLRAYIETSAAEAQKAGKPAPLVFSVSQNDWAGACECEACQAIAKAEGSEAGPLLDFVNAMADGIRDDHPDVFIDTLAYMHTEPPPKTIKPRDSVIIRLCDTGSNFTRPITDPQNTRFREFLLSWAAIAKNLRVWDYAVTYGRPAGVPMASVDTYGPDLRFYKAHNVEGVFTELEYEILADMRDLKIWTLIKQLEQPERDTADFVKEFTDGFYGPAGRIVREYLDLLRGTSHERHVYLSMSGSAGHCLYATLPFVTKAQELFDSAEAACKGDEILLRRVRHARLPLDRITLQKLPDLTAEWVRQGHDPAAEPFARDALAERIRGTWYAQADLRLPEDARATAREAAEAELAPLMVRRAYVPLPEEFSGLPPGDVYQFTADATRNWADQVKVVPAPTEASGITNRLDITDEELPKYTLPMQWGYYDGETKQGASGPPITAEQVPGPGYHWYKMGTFTPRPAAYVYFFWSWIIQLDLGTLCDPDQPDARYDVHARIAFEGPAFPHGEPGDKNAICVERIVLVRHRGE